ncbi:MAG: lipoate--protein ligase family protein [Candidatus Altiarchaeota archaeon]|nr:lipoate--protein ligase family protein [Candidatus Altiarchaeota archaeon]
MDFRLLLDGNDFAARNMGIDEAILLSGSPTLRLYGWDPPAVSIGFFQGIRQEVDIEICKESGVDVIRRITGGGAVFHEHEITYSFVVSESAGLVSRNILESYGQICGAVVSGLRRLGLRAEFKPINDIVVGNKKISGSAQTRKNGVVLQHGTLLLDVNPKKMFSLLKVPNEKIRDKMIQAVEERVTSLNRELGRILDYNSIQRALISGFKENLDLDFVEGSLTDTEKKAADDLYKNKYSTRGWNFMR